MNIWWMRPSIVAMMLSMLVVASTISVAAVVYRHKDRETSAQQHKQERNDDHSEFFLHRAPLSSRPVDPALLRQLAGEEETNFVH